MTLDDAAAGVREAESSEQRTHALRRLGEELVALGSRRGIELEPHITQNEPLSSSVDPVLRASGNEKTGSSVLRV